MILCALFPVWALLKKWLFLYFAVYFTPVTHRKSFSVGLFVVSVFDFCTEFQNFSLQRKKQVDILTAFTYMEELESSLLT